MKLRITIEVELEKDYIHSEDDRESFLFSCNEGTHCIDNELSEITEFFGCACPFSYTEILPDDYEIEAYRGVTLNEERPERIAWGERNQNRNG